MTGGHVLNLVQTARLERSALDPTQACDYRSWVNCLCCRQVLPDKQTLMSGGKHDIVDADLLKDKLRRKKMKNPCTGYRSILNS